jgi:hypothetical protein
MVGSSPLILLNDLILTTNQGLSVENQMHTWGLFSVTPIGIALVLTGIAYFVINEQRCCTNILHKRGNETYC